jgi:hypothetical protein
MESYALLRRLVHGGKIEMSLSYEAEGLDEEDDLNGVISRELDEALAEQGLARSEPVGVDSYHVGRSAGSVDLIVHIGGTVLLVLGGAKVVDEGAKVVRQWAKSLKRLHGKWRSVIFSVEALKVFCLDDLLERHGKESVPVLELVTHHVGAVQSGDGRWQLATPVYICIPDESRRCTHLYVISTIGEILHWGRATSVRTRRCARAATSAGSPARGRERPTSTRC